jgi:hypothetical protein
MHRWFLSYNSKDLSQALRLEAALRGAEPDAAIYIAPKNLRAGRYWLPALTMEIAQATAFILLVGDNDLGPWQVLEYYEALDRRVKEPSFPLVVVLSNGKAAPGLPFLRHLHWIVTDHLSAEHTVARILDATAGAASHSGELWRYSAPYRGLAAMTEADSDFFFGRGRETRDVIEALARSPDKLAVLLGNSGVGKSSLAQAGVLSAFARQNWPETVEGAGGWPPAFRDSRSWCTLTLRPGVEPVRALVEAFLETWQLDRTSTVWPKRRAEWVKGLAEGLTVRDLLDQTDGRQAELGNPKPSAYFLYIDQGEELYARAEEPQRSLFSRLIAQALADPRLRALMSLRSDFLGHLQNDEPLFNAHLPISVPPLRETQLRAVVSKPAELLSARFETGELAADIARRAAEESAKDAGALPLLSYLLDDMWKHMVARGDGVLRLPAAAIELGGVLARRANDFLADNPDAEGALRRLFTLKLATVPENGEPTRRRALRSEFSDAEWRLVTELADYPRRLLVTAAPEHGEAYAEVAHEAIFRRWDKLREWIEAEREFLTWRARLAADRIRWKDAPEASKEQALLMGLSLAQATNWFGRRPEDLTAEDRHFIALSIDNDRLLQSRAARQRRRLLQVAAVGVVLLVTAALPRGVRINQEDFMTVAEPQNWSFDRNATKVSAITKGPDDQLVAKVWQLAPRPSTTPLLTVPASGATLSPDGRHLAVMNDGQLSLLPTDGPSRPAVPIVDLRYKQDGVEYTSRLNGAFSPDGKWFIAASNEGEIIVFDAFQTENRIQVMKVDPEDYRKGRLEIIASRGRAEFLVCDQKSFSLISPERRPIVQTQAFRSETLSQCDYAADEKLVVVTSTDSDILYTLAISDGKIQPPETITFPSRPKSDEDDVGAGAGSRTVFNVFNKDGSVVFGRVSDGPISSARLSGNGESLASSLSETPSERGRALPAVLWASHNGKWFAGTDEDGAFHAWGSDPSSTAGAPREILKRSTRSENPIFSARNSVNSALLSNGRGVLLAVDLGNPSEPPRTIGRLGGSSYRLAPLFDDSGWLATSTAEVQLIDAGLDTVISPTILNEIDITIRAADGSALWATTEAGLIRFRRVVKLWGLTVWALEWPRILFGSESSLGPTTSDGGRVRGSGGGDGGGDGGGGGGGY